MSFAESENCIVLRDYDKLSCELEGVAALLENAFAKVIVDVCEVDIVPAETEACASAVAFKEGLAVWLCHFIDGGLSKNAFRMENHVAHLAEVRHACCKAAAALNVEQFVWLALFACESVFACEKLGSLSCLCADRSCDELFAELCKAHTCNFSDYHFSHCEAVVAVYCVFARLSLEVAVCHIFIDNIVVVVSSNICYREALPLCARETGCVGETLTSCDLLVALVKHLEAREIFADWLVEV